MKPTAIPHEQILELLQQQQQEETGEFDETRAGSPSGRSGLTLPANRSSLGHLLDSMASDMPPEIAVYLAEFEQWLQQNFGYGRNSASESEALERSLLAGRDVPGAVRVRPLNPKL